MMRAMVDAWAADFKDMKTARLTLEIPKEKLAQMPRIGAKLAVEIKEYRKKRSLDANAYMWEICEEIARAVGHACREDIYRKAIREVGFYETIYVSPIAVSKFVENWNAKGIGWQAVPEDYRYQGLVPVTAYFGTSSYNSDEMARVIEWLRMEAEGLGLDVDTPEMKSLKEVGA